METMNNALTELEKPGRKLYALVFGGAMFGGVAKEDIVTKGTSGGRLIYAKPRGRKKFYLNPILEKGAILLEGHDHNEPMFEGDVAVNGVRSMMLGGSEVRMIDAYGDKGEKLIEYLKEKLVLHTLDGTQNILLLLSPPMAEEAGHDISSMQNMPISCPDFKDRLFEALGPPADLSGEAPMPPAAPPRKELLTPKMKERLQEASGHLNSAKPLYKIFDPAGAGTWLLCAMESDGDTLWAVCDIGQGCVEYGTVSLEDLETRVHPQMYLHLERDRFFEKAKLPISELIRLPSLVGQV